MKNETKSALLIIDMERAFIDEGAAHCIGGAAATVDRLGKVIEKAREYGMPVFFVRRIYRANGSDVEFSRYKVWDSNGRTLGMSSTGENSTELPSVLKPQLGDYTIVKPRFSAFFQTELDLILRRLCVKNVVLTGTTTPNCIRTTAYDALSLDYNTIVIEDCCSSQTSEIQAANMSDMAAVGAHIISATEFKTEYKKVLSCSELECVREKVLNDETAPEPFVTVGENVRLQDNF